MATNDPDQQMAYLKAVSIAHGIALKRIMPLLLPDPDVRRAIRDEICEALEGMYGQQSAKPGELHYALQAAMAEVEALFRV